MPLYDARCKGCGCIVRDIFATHPTTKIVQKCVCGSTEFEKLPTAPGAVTFKGDGWATKSPSASDTEN